MSVLLHSGNESTKLIDPGNFVDILGLDGLGLFLACANAHQPDLVLFASDVFSMEVGIKGGAVSDYAPVD
jgi:hypothetical protein